MQQRGCGLSDEEIFRRLSQLLEEGQRAVLCTVIEKRGSGPRDPGAKMLIDAQGTVVGTVGGGEMERLLREHAQSSIIQGCPRTLTFALGVEPTQDSVPMDSICGGEVKVFLDVIKPSARLFIIGSGHVAKPLASLAHMIGLEVVVIDDAPTATAERFPQATRILNHSFKEDLIQADIRQPDLVTIVHGETDHELAALRVILRRDPAYAGLLGSKNKAAHHRRQLSSEGFTTDQLRLLHSPIGLDIGAETPEEIAVSIVAELIAEMRST